MMSRKSRRKHPPQEKLTQPVPASSNDPAPQVSQKFAVFILVVAGFAAYVNSLRGEFVWLDHAEIEEANYRVVDAEDWRRVWYEPIEVYQGRRSGTIVDKGGYWRPIYALSISLDWALWGDRPWLNHAENLLWHLAVVVGLYFLGNMVFGATELGRRAVFWSTLLFAVHPLGVHSVTWISGRKDTMCAAFMVASLIACGLALRNEGRFGRWLALSALCLLLAIGSKELGFLVPLAATILFWPAKDAAKPRFTKPWLVVLGVLWACAIAMAVYRVLVVGATTLDANYPTKSPLNNFAMSAELMWHYVGRILVPYRVELSDAWPVVQQIGAVEILAMLGFVAVAVATLIGLAKRVPWAVAITLFVVLMLPAMGLVPLRHFHAYRYLYPASWGLLTAAVLLVLPLFDRLFAAQGQRTAAVVLGICAICYCLVTVRENTYWTDDITLFQHSVAQDPRHVEGLIELSRLSLERGDNQAAVDYGKRAIQQMDDPSYVAYGVKFYTHFFLGVGLLETGQPTDALEEFKESLIYNPKVARVYVYLGLAASKLEDRAAASKYFFKALELDPLNAEHGGIVAHEYIEWGQPQVAVELLKDYVASHPDDWDNAGTYGVALTLVKEFDEAEAIFERLVRAQPEDATHRIRLAWCQWEMGRHDEARKNFELALKQDPNHPMIPQLQQTILQDSVPQ